MPEPKEVIRRSAIEGEKMNVVPGDCNLKSVSVSGRNLSYYYQ